MNVIIIEDEPMAADELAKMINNLDANIVIKAVLGSVVSALNWFRSNPMPDLIFADIYLSDGSSFDVFTELKDYAPVVFCTAYDQYALQAFNSNGIDYILKPVSEKQLGKSFEKIHKIQNGVYVPKTFKAALTRALSEILPKYRTSLIVYVKDNVIAVDLNDIIFMSAEKNKCQAVSLTAVYPLQDTLDQIMPTLDPDHFFRANRQYIIQRKAVKAIHVLPLRKLMVMLNGSREAIVVSRERKKDFLQWMEGL